MASAQDIIRVAEGEIGSTNGAKYFNHFDTPDYGAWCVAFVRYCMDVAGAAFPWETWYAWDWSDAPSPISPRNLQPGDAVSFDWDDDGGGDHVGIVKSVHDWGIVTIEGNTDWGHVAEKQRVWSVVICGIRPQVAGSGKWVLTDGKWWYQRGDGSWPVGWEGIDGIWYHFDESGWLDSGWLLDDEKWYYLWPEHDGHFGECLTSCCQMIDGSWYVFDKSGAMHTATKHNLKHDGTYGSIIL